MNAQSILDKYAIPALGIVPGAGGGPAPLGMTSEARKLRSGLFTASEVHKLITTKAAKADNATARQYIYEKAFERITGTWASNGGTFKETEWGNENEAAMLAAFEHKTGLKIAGTQIFKKADAFPFGATLDGITEAGIPVEGKCPYNGGIHLQNLANAHNQDWFRANRFDYFVQVQGAMWASDAPEAFFVSYDPGTSRDREPADRVVFENFDALRCGVWKYKRDEEFITGLKAVVADAEKGLLALIETFAQATNQNADIKK